MFHIPGYYKNIKFEIISKIKNCLFVQKGPRNNLNEHLQNFTTLIILSPSQISDFVTIKVLRVCRGSSQCVPTFSKFSLLFLS